MGLYLWDAYGDSQQGLRGTLGWADTGRIMHEDQYKFRILVAITSHLL